MSLHVNAAPAKPHTLSIESEPLLDRRVSGELDMAARAEHALPRQSESSSEDSRHLSCCAGKSRRSRDRSVGRHFATRDRTYGTLDVYPRDCGFVWSNLAIERTD